MNNLKKTTDSGLSYYFTKASTKLFKADMDAALRTMELREIMQVLINYDIISKPEAKEFMDAFLDVLKGWQKPGEGSVVLKVLPGRESRCIFCVYGKGMQVYEFHYKHTDAPEPYNYIIYSQEFGMLYDIKEGILHDIRICNAFLSKTEMQEIKEDN